MKNIKNVKINAKTQAALKAAKQAHTEKKNGKAKTEKQAATVAQAYAGIIGQAIVVCTGNRGITSRLVNVDKSGAGECSKSFQTGLEMRDVVRFNAGAIAQADRNSRWLLGSYANAKGSGSETKWEVLSVQDYFSRISKGIVVKRGDAEVKKLIVGKVEDQYSGSVEIAGKAIIIGQHETKRLRQFSSKAGMTVQFSGNTGGLVREMTGAEVQAMKKQAMGMLAGK